MENSDFRSNIRLCSFFIIWWVVTTTVQAAGSTRFTAIAYHDVVKTRAELASDAVTVDHLINQFEWLLANHYHPVSIADLLAAKKGIKPLPDRAVLLCWDDGYASFYNLVFPLLKAYRYPAVLALVGSWLEPGPSAMVQYGRIRVPRKKFLSWQQLQELADSGLVEIASHSYNLHRALLADAAGDRVPAVSAHKYNPVDRTYESDKGYFDRILRDLEKNSSLLAQRVGKKPRVMVWPYGRYNDAALRAAAKAGMDITLTLDPVPGDIRNLRAIGRFYPTLNPELADYRDYFSPQIAPPVRHFIKVRTANLLDPLPERENHFSVFLDRLKKISPAMVTFEPILRSGKKIMTTFPTPTLPMIDDRLCRLTWHTSHRGATEVFLYLPPVLFSSDKQYYINDKFFEQMGKFAFIDGIIIDFPKLIDDLTAMSMTILQDEGPTSGWNPADRKKARQFLLQHTPGPAARDVLQKLAALQKWQPFLDTWLTIDRAHIPGLTPERVRYLLTYFDTLLLDMRKVEDWPARRNIRRVISRLRSAGLLSRITLFTSRGHGNDLPGRLARLPSFGIINWGYDDDDFLDGRPAIDTIRPFLSKAVHPN